MNMVPALHLGDLCPFGDEPRIKDVRIGERLGMAQPLNIRRTVDANRGELGRYGAIHAVSEMVAIGSGAEREVIAHYLNEPQTLLLCMLSRTERAADVRQEVIEVYMTHRRGQLAPDPADPYARLAGRQETIRRTVAFHAETKMPEYTEALAQLLTDGRANRRLPPWWGDIEVRRAMIALHRQASIAEVLAALSDRYGPLRTPSKSAIGRFWIALDRARGSENGEAA